jgi:hypothetical protein
MSSNFVTLVQQIRKGTNSDWPIHAQLQWFLVMSINKAANNRGEQHVKSWGSSFNRFEYYINDR